MATVRASGDRLLSRKDSLIADQRGAVAFEMMFVYLFLMGCLLLPLADVAIAGLQYIYSFQALRAFGHSIQYAPPPDVTNVSSVWTSSVLAKADPRFPINSDLQVVVDGPIKYYSYTTTVTLSPFKYLKPVLCRSSNTNRCSYTLSYSAPIE